MLARSPEVLARLLRNADRFQTGIAEVGAPVHNAAGCAARLLRAGYRRSPAQLSVLNDTREAADPAEVQILLDQAKPEMDRVVREVMESGQAISTTITELRDLYLTVSAHEAPLAAVNYGAPRRTLFRDSIRLVTTADLWLGEGARTGAYRVRSAEEVVQASRHRSGKREGAVGRRALSLSPHVGELDVATLDQRESGKARCAHRCGPGG